MRDDLMLYVLRALAMMAIVVLLTGGYVVVGVLESRWDVDARVAVAEATRDTLVAHLAAVRADSVELVAAIRRERARVVELCAMRPVMELESCITLVDTRLQRRRR
jgi:hypothetical protein